MLKSNMHSFPLSLLSWKVKGTWDFSRSSILTSVLFSNFWIRSEKGEMTIGCNVRQFFNPDDQFDFSLSLHTSKRSIERYSRKFTWNKVLKAYQLQHSSNNLLKETWLYQKNGAFMDATSFPGFSPLLRERTPVATGHEEMCVNKLRGEGRPSNRSFTKSCGLEEHEILSGVGRRFPLQNSALLSASYDNT